MTTKIYSKLDPSKLLHMIVREIPDGRTNLCTDDQFLQCAALKLPIGTTFKPHQHLFYTTAHNYTAIPQEAWAVVKGKVKVIYYDTDGTLLHMDIIEAGELSMTFFGGHNYQILSENSFVWEFKTGPYRGVHIDKVFLNDEVPKNIIIE